MSIELSHYSNSEYSSFFRNCSMDFQLKILRFIFILFLLKRFSSALCFSTSSRESSFYYKNTLYTNVNTHQVIVSILNKNKFCESRNKKHKRVFTFGIWIHSEAKQIQSIRQSRYGGNVFKLCSYLILDIIFFLNRKHIGITLNGQNLM